MNRIARIDKLERGLRIKVDPVETLSDYELNVAAYLIESEIFRLSGDRSLLRGLENAVDPADPQFDTASGVAGMAITETIARLTP